MNKSTTNAGNSAVLYKDQGNVHLSNGRYEEAASSYTKGIVINPEYAALYSNRATACLKLQRWDSVIEDCQRCLDLGSLHMKAYYKMAQAQRALKDFSSAESSARQAYNISLKAGDVSIAVIGKLVLECKRAAWDQKERTRERAAHDIEREIIRGFENDKGRALSELEQNAAAEGTSCSESARNDVEEEWDAKIAIMRVVFDRSRAEDDKKRVVPDWAIDAISMEFMLDPVMTKSGNSYERSSLLAHLKDNPIDPATREPLHPSDLRPNLALREACEAFLEKNGWAADW